jgi:GT2 family glycosyltransferase/tetratricopeptide (TPR) repeat protein
MPKYSIIIPVCNNEGLTKACLESVYANSRDCEIIIVDNGSKIPWIGPEKIIRNEQNRGFPIACNQGIREACGQVIVLLNNDTIVSPLWLERLDAHFVNYDLVGPLTNFISGPQQIFINPPVLPAGVPFFADQIYQKNVGRSMPFYRLVFFCVAIKRAVIEKVGLLDEEFTPGNFEDDDYCMRAIEAGFRLGIANDVFIYHKGSATHKSENIEYAKLLQRNFAIFQTKFPAEKYTELKKKSTENCAGNSRLPKRSLSLVMVCKNEELGIFKAITSAKPYVDEIVVAIDNKSVDKTEAIAENLGATIKHFDWRNDFAWARNFAHEGVKSDWILFLDGHEYIKTCVNLEARLDSPAEGLLCLVELEGGGQFRNPRIYRNGRQFEGAIHEMQNCNTLSVYSDFVVKHARVGGQSAGAIKIRDKQRDDQTAEILGKQLKDDKTNVRASFHLSLHEQSKGHYKEAIKYHKKNLRYAKNHSDRWYVLFNKALCHYSLNHHLRTLWACSDAEKESPGRWEIAKLRGLAYKRAGMYDKAVQYFVDSFERNFGDETYKPWKPNHSEVWDLIGECYFNTQKLDLAYDAFNQAWKQCEQPEKKKLLYDRAKMMKTLQNQ